MEELEKGKRRKQSMQKKKVGENKTRLHHPSDVPHGY